MNFPMVPWHLLVLALASWLNREQQQVLEYRQTANRALREKLGKKRSLFTDDQRRRLAVKDKVLGRKLLSEIGTFFTPDTILSGHRELIARKWDASPTKSNAKNASVDCSRITIATRRETILFAGHHSDSNPCYRYARMGSFVSIPTTILRLRNESRSKTIACH